MRPQIVFFILLFITLFAFIIRFWDISKIPAGFNIDEAAFGYNAYSILKTGKDEFGVFLPVNLKSFGDYKAAGDAYFLIPSIVVFGLNEFAVRFPSVIFGTLLTILTYFLTKKLTGDQKTAIISSLLIAICPTMIFMSRIQSDPLASVFFVVLGIYFFFLWLEKKYFWLFLLTAFSFLISLITYQAPRIFFPFFLPFLLLLYWKTFLTKQKILFIIIGGIIALCIASLFLNGGARYQQVSVFNQPQVQLLLDESLREDAKTPLISRIFHNKFISYGRFLTENYFSYLSFDFLFYQASIPLREKVPNTGILYLIEFPFIAIGAYTLMRKKVKWGSFILGWIVLTPFCLSFITGESPNMHRFLLAIVPLEIVSAYGIIQTVTFFQKNRIMYASLLVIIPLLFTYSIFYYLHELFIHEPVHQPWNRNSASKELVTLLNEKGKSYKKVMVTNTESNTYMFILFYNHYDPKKYQQSGSLGNVSFKGFDNYIFVPINCPLYSGNSIDPAKGDKDTLYVERGFCNNPPNAVVNNIKWGDGSNAFKVMEIDPDWKGSN